MDDIGSEQAFRDGFEARVKQMTLDELPAFIQEAGQFQHDYGSICLAIAFIGAAAAWAFEKGPQGGITGFQAGCVGWEFLRQWGSPGLGKTSTRLLNYDNLLYPQYEHQFRGLSPATWESVQDEARKRLAGDDVSHAHPEVVAHWQSVADGHVPFGLQLEN